MGIAAFHPSRSKELADVVSAFEKRDSAAQRLIWAHC